MPGFPSATLLALSLFSAIAQPALAWDATGHETVATIAQVYLHPSSLPVICSLLGIEVVPEKTSVTEMRTKCHLASVATWADKERLNMKWSAAMHYVGAVGDYPRPVCQFPGTEGWDGVKSVNILDATKNVTGILAAWSGINEKDDAHSLQQLPLNPEAVDTKRLEEWTYRPLPGPKEMEAFRFLVHFLGDLHQPLHLTGRNIGGNLINVTFEGLPYRFHAAWDKAIPNKLMSLVPLNYTLPLPEHQTDRIPSSTTIEAALKGSPYHAFVRRMLWEGVDSRWKSESPSWLACPSVSSGIWDEVKEIAQGVISSFLEKRPHYRRGQKVEILPDGPLVCPYAWAKPTHEYACGFAWPEEFTSKNPADWPLLELATPEYFGVIKDEMAVERFLVQGGMRLAGILNWLFALPEPEQ
ncbi:S1/P1 nuclease [Coprinopsis sp. MPI-PUGE-AT-0042]|nr:S1/P1 nuclease [Coprinopsis sp. MPI-PUGE-AT-0042]KAH6909572.1 S1/P1 nuclease [Coprinopsis sp. MPI-PUGE-AT-0042]